LIVTCPFRKLVSKTYIAIWTENFDVNQITFVGSSCFIKTVSPIFVFIDHQQRFS